MNVSLGKLIIMPIDLKKISFRQFDILPLPILKFQDFWCAQQSHCQDKVCLALPPNKIKISNTKLW